MPDLTADEIVRMLDMKPHPEGGFFCETYRDPNGHEGRAHSTAIYYLLAAGDLSAWHRVDATEVWHWYAGAPLALTISENGHDAASHRLGQNLAAGERPQVVVPPHAWQTAESLGHWTLIGCTVAPGFLFESFEMAPPDWKPVPRG
ncbi:cupin domain-containing protein [Amorphus coralli]|uniref:cupin domain-containing protein n=1 Tax=Amorphus coralli TaxID=340680 RepID=UPI000365F11E|nr:cupin domain-containing protein [Amorphus coralli]